jgi:hypothetical protein
MMLAAAVMASACIAVGGQRIRAADLVPAVPAFAALPPEAPLGYAPAPGARRMLNPRELERLAGQHGISLGGAPSLCVERAVERLTVARGETVKVEVSSGGAQLSLPARVETAGRTGDTILLRNPESGRRFPARAEGRGKVRVDAKEIAPLDAAVPAGTRGGSR